MPIAAVRDLLKDHSHHIASMAQGRAKEKVEDAFRRGYLTSAMRPWALALCQQDEESFDDFLKSSAPPYAHLTRQALPNRAPASPATREEGGLAAAVCSQLGLPPGALKD